MERGRYTNSMGALVGIVKYPGMSRKCVLLHPPKAREYFTITPKNTRHTYEAEIGRTERLVG